MAMINPLAMPFALQRASRFKHHWRTTMSTLTKLALLAVVAVPVVAQTPGYMQIPGTETKLKVWGYVDVLGGVEVKGGSKAGLRGEGGFPSAQDIALDGDQTSKNTSFMTAGNSRLYVESATPSAIGDIKTTMRFQLGGDKDFNKSSETGNLRMTRAFFQISDWFQMGLQASLFYTQAEPTTVGGNLPGVGGMAAPQIRVMSKLNDKNTLTFALEDTFWSRKTQLADPYNNYTLIGRMDSSMGSLGDLSLRAGTTHYKNADASKFSYFGGIGSTFNIGPDQFMVDVAGGAGMANFMNAMGAGQAVVQADNELLLWKSASATAQYTRNWTSNVKSNLWGSYVRVKGGDRLKGYNEKNVKAYEDGKVADAKKKGVPVEMKDGKNVVPKWYKYEPGYAAPIAYAECNRIIYAVGLNTIYTPVKNLDLALEASYNARENFGGQKGKEANISFEATYYFK